MSDRTDRTRSFRAELGRNSIATVLLIAAVLLVAALVHVCGGG